MTEEELSLKVRLRFYGKYKGTNDNFFGLMFQDGISEPCLIIRALRAVLVWSEEVQVITKDPPYEIIVQDKIGNLVYYPDIKPDILIEPHSELMQAVGENKVKSIREILKEEKTKNLDEIIEKKNNSLEVKQKGRPKKIKKG